MSNTDNTATDMTPVAKRVLAFESSKANRAADYETLASHFGLTPDSDSATVTAAAHSIVTMVRTTPVAMLKGRDPGATVSTYDRASWKLARAVRIGLVSAAERLASDSDSADDGDNATTPDYLERITLAAKMITKRGLPITRDDMLAALERGIVAANE